jgi:asparagine synthase (glutamine-hydrolysing)
VFVAVCRYRRKQFFRRPEKRASASKLSRRKYMCGITGYWNFQVDETPEAMRSRIVPMTNSMLARGPDSGGVWIDPAGGLALGHRRLAIVDLSPAGRQPMSTPDGRYVICYNGEVYNHAPLRAELEALGAQFRGYSDTETLLYGCALLGVEATLTRLTGMFAFAFWDRIKRRLTLARDRLGIKPLYFGKFGSLFLFGSELKPLVLHGGWSREINRDAIVGLLDNCYIPAPMSIYQGIYKLRQGYLLEVDAQGRAVEHRWWNALSELQRRRKAGLNCPDKEMEDRLDALLRDAVKSRMVADVPLGAFLSGGIDSSTVAALMQAQSDRPIRTFSIGFEEEAYNEAPYAKAVARHLGTLHTEEYMSARQAWESIPNMAEFYDEPFADSSQLPTYLLSRITRKHVTIALSGDGGDELFCGYRRYFDFMHAFRRGPAWRRLLIRALGNHVSEKNLNRLARLLPGGIRPPDFGRRVVAAAAKLALTPADFYRRQIFFNWPEPEAMVRGGRKPVHAYTEECRAGAIPDPVTVIQFQDTVNYLPDDILVKVDRASMAVSLEARVPLIDHRVCAFAWSLPPRMRMRDGRGKWILRRVLYRYVPEKLIDRPKMGFGVPTDVWLRGPLRDWAENLLAPERLRREGFLEADMIYPIWQRHLAGDNYQYWLWIALMFQAWLERWNKPFTAEDAPLTVEYAA